jgi:hypothetical protein
MKQDFSLFYFLSTTITNLPVDTDRPAAIRARPADFFVRHKLPNAKPLDVFEILDCAHVVSGSIPFIHVFHLLAGKTVAFKTKLCIPLLQHFAVFDLAPENADGFVGVFLPASKAGVFVSQVSHAGTAVHSAGGDERDFDHLASFNIRSTKKVSPLDGTFF